MHPGIPIALVFVGCCTNVIFLELIVSEEPGAGNIITFMQFLFIATEGLALTTKFLTVKSVIPLKNYILMVTMFFVVQVINNMAFNFNIPMTLHIIFRAGSLIASLILGKIIMKKSYMTSKYVSVILISVGIVICTIASVKPSDSDEPGKEGNSLLTWTLGIAMLCFALYMTARMGIFQEQIYTRFGKHPREALFYNHALPLPGFLLVGADIYRHVLAFNQSEPYSIPLLDVGVPKMWLFLLGNVVTQYICIRSVFILTTECTALTVTLVVTLRKFMSLIFSIIYFKNQFTLYHWIGAVLVFGGTLMFTETLPFMKKSKVEKRE